MTMNSVGQAPQRDKQELPEFQPLEHLRGFSPPPPPPPGDSDEDSTLKKKAHNETPLASKPLPKQNLQWSASDDNEQTYEASGQQNTAFSPSERRSVSMSFFRTDRGRSEQLVEAAAAAGITPPTVRSVEESTKILRQWKDRLLREEAALRFYKAEQHRKSVAPPSFQNDASSKHYAHPTVSSGRRARAKSPTVSSRFQSSGKQPSNEKRAVRATNSEKPQLEEPEWRETPLPPWMESPPKLSASEQPIAKTMTISPSKSVTVGVQTERLPPEVAKQLWSEAQHSKPSLSLFLVDANHNQFDVPKKREEEQNEFVSSPSVGVVCPLCGRDCFDGLTLTRDHIRECLNKRREVEESLTKLVSPHPLLCTPVPLVSDSLREMATMIRKLVLCDSSINPFFVVDEFNPWASKCFRQLLLRCPMGAKCCGNGTILFDQILSHVVACWEVTFYKAGSSRTKLGSVKIGKNVDLIGDIIAPAKPGRPFGLQLSNVLRAASDEIHPWVLLAASPITSARALKAQQRLGILRSCDGAVVTLSMDVIECWACDFDVIFFEPHEDI